MRLLVVLACVGAAVVARADFVVRQQTDSADGSRPTTYKFRGDLARIDTVGGSGRDLSIIMNLATDEVFNLIHQEKVAYAGVLSQQRQKREAAMKASGIDVESLRPVPTGQRQRIGDWDAEEYLLEIPSVKLRIWVARAFPDGPAIKALLSRFSKANTGGALNPDAMNVPGMVVKSESDTPLGHMTTTLLSARDEPLPASEFQVPGDFEVKPFPAMQRVPMPGR